MLSAFKQFAERTVNSRSSTGRNKIGSTSGSLFLLASIASSASRSTKITNWERNIVAASRIASFGSSVPSVSNSMLPHE